MNKSKCLEYYLDAKEYGSKEIQENIEKAKKEFLNKNVYVDIFLNDFGVYVVTLYFENKDNFFNKIKLKFRKKNKRTLLLEENNLSIDKKIDNTEKKLKMQKIDKIRKDKTKERLEKYYGNHYGQYRSTGIYKPY